jgi:putative tryptophan/tyrosine transport system substrate-binding protein
MNAQRRQWLQRLALLTGAGLAGRADASDAISPRGKNPPRIYMVTWRGRTEVERGFTDYWREHAGAAEWVWRDAAQNRDTLQTIRAEIADTQPDLVHTWGTPPTLALAGTFDKPDAVIASRIPLVFSAVADPVGARLVARREDLALPTRRLSGVTHVAPLSAQWEAMNAYRPTQRIGIIYNRLEPNAVATLADWQQLAARIGIEIVAEPFDVNAAQQATVDGIEEKLARLKAANVEWLYLGPDSFLFTQVNTVASLATELGIPTFAATESHLNTKTPVTAGLVSKFLHVGQFAAFKGMRLLRESGGSGASPAADATRAPAIETLRRFSLIVRMDSAHQLKLYPPLKLLDIAEFR